MCDKSQKMGFLGKICDNWVKKPKIFEKFRKIFEKFFGKIFFSNFFFSKIFFFRKYFFEIFFFENIFSNFCFEKKNSGFFDPKMALATFARAIFGSYKGVKCPILGVFAYLEVMTCSDPNF